jgi:antitoxin (DNA-binding transcriptional repressor) of toxin-antitoxin stability system
MTTVDIQKGTLESCVDKSQSERVIVTRKGTPVALVVSVKGLDKEQIELGSNDKFWKMIQARRKDRTVDRQELERMIKAKRKSRKSRVSRSGK